MFFALRGQSGYPFRKMLACAISVALGCATFSTFAVPAAPNRAAPVVEPTASLEVLTGGGTRYDSEYPSIGYSSQPQHNRIVELQKRLNSGAVRLAFEGPRGYLDSALRALDIDASSQTLVYSKTSLQFTLISAATPRAIYFNDDTYVAWIPGTAFLEIATLDSALGPVFYTLSNESPRDLRITREISRCLTCHDTWGMAGGGVPRFLFMSTVVDTNGEALTGKPGDETTDQTPIHDRWGGWFVTGHHANDSHLGNILAKPGDEDLGVETLRRGDLDSAAGLFDARNYLTEKSDIVALMVFEHQAYIAGFLTRTNFKSRTLLARGGFDPAQVSWDALPSEQQKPLRRLLEPLLQALLFVNAAPLKGKVTSSSGYDTWFQSQGPRDRQGRSLRELDLQTRLFKYRLSYLVFSSAFDGLPPCEQEYLYRRLADILNGRDHSPLYTHLDAGERQSVLEILTATKPAFAKVATQRAADCEKSGCDRSTL